MRGDLDLDGDLFAAMDLRTVLSDRQLLARPGPSCSRACSVASAINPQWIAKHYDSENMQLFAIDETYQVYTPGIYLSEDDSLEEGAERKLEYAFSSLGLKPGDTVLDVGCGWGGFVRYCASGESPPPASASRATSSTSRAPSSRRRGSTRRCSTRTSSPTSQARVRRDQPDGLDRGPLQLRRGACAG